MDSDPIVPLTALDASIVLAFVAYAAWAGFRARRVAGRSLEEYFLAGRTLRGWQAGLSMAATQFAADTPLLVTGLIAVSGIFALWRLWIYALAFLLMGFVLAPAWRRAGVLTDAELTELRYGGWPAATLRGAKAVYFGTIFNCTVLAMVLLAATAIAEPFLVWHDWLPDALYDPWRSLVRAIGVPVSMDEAGADLWTRSADNALSLGAIVAVTALYSTTGGLRSVVATDLVQLGIAMGSTLVYAVVVVRHVGGLQTLHARLGDLFTGEAGGMSSAELLAFTPSGARDAGLAIVGVYAIQWLAQMNADGTGYLAQRSMACRSDRDARQAAVIFTIAQVLLRSLLWLPIGLGLLLVFPPEPGLSADVYRAAREASFVRGVAELLPTGARGLMLTGLLAALASTVDTHLNWGASYWTNDLYKRFVCEAWLRRTPSERSLVWVARGSTVLILLVATVIMTQLASIRTAWEMSLLLGAGMGGMLVLRWHWWRVSGLGELVALVVATALAPVLLVSVGGEAVRLLVMFLATTTAGVVASMLSGPEAGTRLDQFYQRVRPPGVWGPVARRAGDDPAVRVARWWRTVGHTIACAATIFCFLTGFGTWLVGGTPPVWLPCRAGWIVLNLVVGAICLRWWWRAAFGRSTPQDVHAPHDQT